MQLLGNLQNNALIKAQTVGALCVYPNNPLGLSVLVDTGFTLFEVGAAPGSAFVLQNGGSPATVTLAAPPSLSYYATIYWDQTINALGVLYSTVSATPAPLLPVSMYQIPLAVVLIANTTTQITAGLITDARKWWTFGHADFANTAFGAGGATFNLAGATDVWIYIKITASGGTLALQNLRAGQKVSLQVLNSTAGALTMFANFTSPAGVLYNTQQVSRTGGGGGNWGLSSGSQSFSGSGAISPNECYWMSNTQPLFS